MLCYACYTAAAAALGSPSPSTNCCRSHPSLRLCHLLLHHHDVLYNNRQEQLSKMTDHFIFGFLHLPFLQIRSLVHAHFDPGLKKHRGYYFTFVFSFFTNSNFHFIVSSKIKYTKKWVLKASRISRDGEKPSILIFTCHVACNMTACTEPGMRTEHGKTLKGTNDMYTMVFSNGMKHVALMHIFN